MAIEAGYNKVKSNLIYFGVRLFGRGHWKENTDAKKHLVTIERVKKEL